MSSSFRVGCAQCDNSDSTSLKRCSACHSVFYCCTDHQRRDWSESHKVLCAILKAARASTPLLQRLQPVKMDADTGPEFVSEVELLLRAAQNAPPSLKQLESIASAKALALEVIVWPDHLLLESPSMPPIVASVFRQFAQCFIDTHHINPTACRAVVAQTRRQLHRYLIYAHGPNYEKTIVSGPNNLAFAELAAQLEYNARNYDAALMEFQTCIDMVEVAQKQPWLKKMPQAEVATFLTESSNKLIRFYMRSISCAGQLQKYDLAENYYMLAMVLDVNRVLVLQLQMDYCQILDDKAGQPGVEHKEVMDVHNGNLQTYKSVAKEALELTEFRMWSRATAAQALLLMSFNFKTGADEQAELLLNHHPCACEKKDILCSDVVFANAVLKAQRMEELSDDLIFSQEYCDAFYERKSSNF
ncbi:hypothetical protein BC830DRAFT_1117853 [Chytriomyces sp. MP71]|nr:hypothetical protein BC830DRAFT_1117853 [Chytriomyces sp. MP71]